MPFLIPCKPVRLMTKEEFQMKLRQSYAGPKLNWPLPAELSTLPPAGPAPGAEPSCTGPTSVKSAIVLSSSSPELSPTAPACSRPKRSDAAKAMVKPALAPYWVPQRLGGATALGGYRSPVTGVKTGAKRRRSSEAKMLSKESATAGSRRQCGIEGFLIRSLRCNPWQPTQFVLTASEHFGVAGSGKVYVVNTAQGLPPQSPVQLVGCWGTSDGAFDACFSEVDRDVVGVACGDGLKLYSLQQSSNRDGVMPLVHLTEHCAEVVGIEWCHDAFLSCSWDGTVKLYKAAAPQASLLTFHEHLKEVYEVSCSSRSPASFLSCSGDGTWRLWDSRAPRSVLMQVGHNHQPILSIDFNKQDNSIFATGGVDRSVHLWDVRRSQQPLAVLPGHDNACRRVRFSPHSRTLLASSGYDCRVCLWDLNQPQRPLTARYAHHREFVVGLGWSLGTPNALASVSWDATAVFWVNGQPLTASPPSGPLPLAAPPPRLSPVRPKGLPVVPPPLPPPSAPPVR